jgi:hypothetical protein
MLRVRAAAAEALGKMNASAALPELDHLAGLDVDGRLASTALEAAQRIRAGTVQSDELKRLRQDVDELRTANAKLQEKIADLDPAALNGKRNGRTRSAAARHRR